MCNFLYFIANGKSESNNTVGIAVGVSVAAVLVIGLVGVLLMVIGSK